MDLDDLKGAPAGVHNVYYTLCFNNFRGGEKIVSSQQVIEIQCVVHIVYTGQFICLVKGVFFAHSAHRRLLRKHK